MDAQRGIARRMIAGLPPDGLTPAWERDFSSYPPAGVIVFRRDFDELEALRRLTSRLRELARPRRLFIAIDEEGGHVSQLAGHLVVPPNALLLGRGAPPGEIEWLARVTGKRLRALGIDWNLAPVADVHSEPRNPVIGPRAFGHDPDTVARCVGEVVRGFRAAGLASCLKHFPGHGDTALDSHLALPVDRAPRDVLERRELVPFRRNLEADAVMTAHVVYPAFDGERAATFSRAIAHDLLRSELGFTGLGITDALEMRGALGEQGLLEAARRALEAGTDLLLFAFHDEEVRRVRLELARALAGGAIDRTAFDAARPRLAAFDRAHPEPTAEELAAPLESLTPPDWRERIARIVERGLAIEGALPAATATGPWHVVDLAGPPPAIDAALAARGVRVRRDEPERPLLKRELDHAGIPLAEPPQAAVNVVAIASRTALDAERIAHLRTLCHERPTVLVGLQNDAFLADFPEAALRVSAADATAITREVVARTLAGLRRERGA